MKIFATEIEPWQKELLLKALPDDTFIFTDKKVSPELAKQHNDTEILTIFVESKITQEILDLLPNLKLIVTRTTGYDNIDISAAHAQDILVCNAPTYATTAVAEYTFALILSLARMMYITCYNVKQEGCFSREGLCGFELKGKTIGIIGMGNIGKEVTSIAHGFGMQIIAYDLYQKPELATKLNFTYVDLPQLLETSDIITLHLPLTKDTHHIINSSNTCSIKQGAFFINTARGGLVDTKALLDALKNGTLAGCAVDVLEDTTSPEAKQLISHSCALVTPHNAYNTREAAHRLIQDTIGIIKAFKAGTPINSI